MTYHMTECVLDLLAASGPQSYQAIRREVDAQATCGQSLYTTVTAIKILCDAGLVSEYFEAPGPVFELTDHGYYIMGEAANQAEALRQAHMRQLDSL